MPDENTLTVPRDYARHLLESGSYLTCRLLNARQFVSFCTERGYKIDEKRLRRLEELGLFAPIFRATALRTDGSVVLPPPKAYDGWFDEAGFVETLVTPDAQRSDGALEDTTESYYSEFQIDHLDILLPATTLTIHAEQYFSDEAMQSVNWQERMEQHIAVMKGCALSLTPVGHRQAKAALCQYISNRYYPHTQTDQRTIRVPVNGPIYSDRWICLYQQNWSWRSFCQTWNPKDAESLFQLTPKKLEHAYSGLSTSLWACDPISDWYELKQFISLDKRKRLKGKALRAETFLEAALMLRLLYKDLYGEELPYPNQAGLHIFHQVPELELRRDSRKYLEFVANAFGVNPQPKAVIMVEGSTEEHVINTIFRDYYGVHAGRLSIEIINLWGVGTATGSKREDRYRAIIRLMDYLHHHQTYTFLILDNENYAQKLRSGAKEATSTFRHDKHVTRPEYIKVWNSTFEFDNFSCTEIAKGLTALTEDHVIFGRNDIIACSKSAQPGSELSKLYHQRTGLDLPKLKLAEILCQMMFDPNARRRIENRPIIRFLNKIRGLSALNHLPTSHEIWVHNQDSKFLRRAK